jgi:hypothetical protein
MLTGQTPEKGRPRLFTVGIAPPGLEPNTEPSRPDSAQLLLQ